MRRSPVAGLSRARVPASRGSPVPTFIAKQVCAALDVSHGTLNSWAHAGFFREFDAATTTPGKARKFSFNDLFRLLLSVYCSDFGFAPATSRKLSNLALDNSDYLRIRIVQYADNSEDILLDDQQYKDNPTLELSIFPDAIRDELSRRLAASDDPKVAATVRKRRPKRRAATPKREG
jgi:hypothetical protein